MKDSRARAVVLLEVAKRTASPEVEAKATALAEAWLILAAMNDALTLWADEAKRKMN